MTVDFGQNPSLLSRMECLRVEMNPAKIIVSLVLRSNCREPSLRYGILRKSRRNAPLPRPMTRTYFQNIPNIISLVYYQPYVFNTCIEKS